MELRSGLPLMSQQFHALFRKNMLLTWRNKRATFLQLFSSFLFLLLMFGVEKAQEAQYKPPESSKEIKDTATQVTTPIPPCEDKLYVKLPCFDFLWSGNSSGRVSRIVDSIRRNNPGRSIPPSKVMSFATPKEVDAWLYGNPMRCPGALHFRDVNATVISYGIQINNTIDTKRGHSEDLLFKFHIPLQVAAEREIARFLFRDSSLSWTVGIKDFPHPADDQSGPPSSLDTAMPIFFLAIAMFGFVLQMSSLVTEKELKLRQTMTLMGLYDTAYWLSWFTWEGILSALSSLFIVLFGMMFHFDFFLKNSFAVLFLLFFLFQLNMVGFAFMLSAFISKSSSSTSVGFSTFLVGFLTQLGTGFGFPYSSLYPKACRIIWSLFPPNLLAEALVLLFGATSFHSDPGISWSSRANCAPNDEECVISINDIYKWLVATFFLWSFLAIYFDSIFPNASGVRKSAFYFLNPGYWTGKGGNKVKEGGICSCIRSAPPLDKITADDVDVLEEESVVKAQAKEGQVDSSIAVQIHGLVKTYPGTTQIGCCCRCKRTSPYHAIKGLWVNFAKDQLFCLLGPNGAGKTTTINCLTGITPVTGGDATIYGYSIRNSIGMSNIRKLIGVCPQFDILWELLSGQEHLHLFANIKGLSPASINSVVEKSLAEVRLTEAGKIRAGSYSGGMKRRLSVAIALIGDPKLVILDEPTTGMDPITRRHVWDIIENAKKGRAIILTTHSMEEADILSDRIGIMAKGRLRCIGTSIRLKSRFGTGFVANLSFSSNNAVSPGGDMVLTAHQEAVKQFFKTYLTVKPKEENKAFLTFVIPHDKEAQLAKFFAKLQGKAKEFGIADIQLGLTTLEEVFLNIAKQAELENAASEGRTVTLTLTTGASLQIPVGATFVGIPGTESADNPRGTMVEVHWEQDDNGNLCILGHSQEMPIPPSVRLPASLGNNLRRLNPRGRRGPVHGIVLDANEITNAHF